MRQTPGAAWRPRRTATPGVVATHCIVATRRAVAMRQQRGTLQLRCGALTPKQRCDVVRCAAASERAEPALRSYTQPNCATKLRTVKGETGATVATAPHRHKRCALCRCGCGASAEAEIGISRCRRGAFCSFVCLFVCWGSCLCDRSATIVATAVSGSASFSKGRTRCSTSTSRGTACRRAPDRSRCGSGCRCLTSAVLYRTLRYSGVLRGTRRYSGVLWGTLRYSPVLYGTLQHSVVLCGTLRCRVSASDRSALLRGQAIVYCNRATATCPSASVATRVASLGRPCGHKRSPCSEPRE